MRVQVETKKKIAEQNKNTADENASIKEERQKLMDDKDYFGNGETAALRRKDAKIDEFLKN